jgi:hypothetical protein
LTRAATFITLAKWAGIFGITVQQIGAQERGITEEAFKEMLVEDRGKVSHGAESSEQWLRRIFPQSERQSQQGLQDQPYWRPFFEGYLPVHDWLRDGSNPDIASSSTTIMAELLTR